MVVYKKAVTMPRDQWERIAAVVRAAQRHADHHPFPCTICIAIDALTPDDIEAVKG